MYIELHQLQNFAPSCLNRDDTNSPKDCMFGGVRRARISSQCIKRSIREHAREHGDLTDHLGTRTKRLHQQLVDRLTQAGRSGEDAHGAALTAIRLMGLDAAAKSKKDEDADDTGALLTQYVLFLGDSEIAQLAALIDTHWDAVVKASEKTEKKKKASTKDVPKELADAIKKVLDAPKAADVALFGRMLADLPDKNVDAACQVAHALSTHKVVMELDFFTAVDDLKPDDSSGADMMGTVAFNSACFYCYAVIHWEQLVKNLGGDVDLARKTVEAFLRGACEAIPTGKQNTFAAHNPPSLVLGVVREKGAPWSLANAFEQPVHANGAGLVAGSIAKLNNYHAKLSGVYGNASTTAVHCTLEGDVETPDLGTRADTFDQVVQTVLDRLPEEA